MKKITTLFVYMIALFVANYGLHGQNLPLGNSVILIDQDLPHLTTLLAGVQPGVKIQYFDKSMDPISGIDKVIRENAPLRDLHIFTHGKSGAILFPYAELNEDVLRQNEANLKSWKKYFKEDGDILLYGCDVAKGSDGESFINSLAQFTDLDVAASEDFTGASSKGGDWILEKKTGFIESQEVISAEAKNKYTEILGDVFVLDIDGTATHNGNVISNFYAGLAGHTGVLVQSSIPDLSSYELVYIVQPTRLLTATEITNLLTYLGRGGLIVFEGEHGGYTPTQNNNISDAVIRLGAHFSIVNQATDGGWTACNRNMKNEGIIKNLPVFENVNTIDYNYMAPIAMGGAAQVMIANRMDASQTYMAIEKVGNGHIIMFADQNIWDNVAATTCNNNAIFFENLLKFSLENLSNILKATLTTLEAYSISGSSATSGGNITSDNGSVITQRGVCWSTSSQSPTTANSKVLAASGGSGLFNLQITGLSLNTTYYARAFAINSNGTAYGNTITFTTPAVVNTSPTAVADNYSVLKNGTLSGNVLLNDFDDDGNAITATIVAKPAYHSGTFSLSANGAFTYTHNGTNAPSDFFSYYLSDGISTSATVGVGITIVVPQNAPVGANKSINLGTASTYSFSAADFTFSDADGHTFNGIKMVSKPAKGVMKYNGLAVADGANYNVASSLTFDVSTDVSETTFSFVFKVIDSSGEESGSTYTFTLTVAQPFNSISGTATPKSAYFPLTTYVDSQVAITGAQAITDPKISISSGFQTGDVLAHAGALPSGITASYNSTTGTLAFTGTGTAQDWQAIFRKVTFTTTSSNIANRTVNFLIADAVSLTFNNKQHYYQYIAGSTTWSNAMTAAASKTFFGLTGYLATITSMAENDFISIKLQSDGWVGGSDDFARVNTALGTNTFANQTAVEGKWYWVAGPEKGTAISVNNGSPTSVGGAFINWASGEPNNSGSEHYMQLYSSNQGKWNDLPNTNLPGYVVEYGGYSNDAVISVSHSRVLQFNELGGITLSNATLNENNAVNAKVGDLAVSGAESTLTFTYTLVSGTGSADNTSFTIAGNEIKAAASFNYEGKNSYSIRVRVTDNFNISTEKIFAIAINNLNDIASVIAPGQTFSLNENSSATTVAGTVLATDADGTTTYQNWTIVSGNTGNAFGIDPSTGKIAVNTAVAIDYETNPSFTLMVTVGDGVNTSQPVAVVLKLNNINDAAPVIGSGQIFSMNENIANGTAVGKVTATDVDGTTTYQNWAIVGGNTDDAFAINATTGQITVNSMNAIDFEANPAFTLMVQVGDGPNTSQPVAVTLNLNNVNDIAPVIASGQTLALDENSVGATVVATLTATDADGTTTYQNWKITSGNTDDAFTIDPHTGKITVDNAAAIDFEVNSSFTLTVTVSDGQNTSLPVAITVNLNNLNDTPPVLTPGQIFTLDENNTDGMVVGTVLASDEDGTTTFQNWTIGSGNTDNAFTIDPTTGKITVNNATAIDFEINSDFTLMVTVSDGQNTSLPVAVTLNLNNLNDTAPVLTQGQIFTLDENSTDGTVAGNVLASDADGTTTYENWTIASGNTDNAFSIDPTTGKIIVNNVSAIDFETNSSFTLMVTVSDGQNTSMPVAVTLNLNNLNDTAPALTSGQIFTLDENSTDGTVAGNVLASDEDGTTTYQNWKIVSGNTDNAFTIDPTTGTITVNSAAAIDFEINSSFTLMVTVSDGQNTSLPGPVTLNLNNVNDTAPVLTSGQIFTLDENSTDGTVAGIVLASDEDGLSTYQNWTIASGNTDNAFTIDPTTGKITVNSAAAIDFETNSDFTLMVTVSDGQNTSVPVSVTLNLNNLNDTAPMLGPDQIFTLDENSVDGTVAGIVLASDEDGTTTYQNWKIASGNTDNAFTIDPTTGKITVNTSAAIDFETNPTLTLFVTVNDGENTSEPVKVIINLSNLNDIAPVIPSDQNFTISENPAPGSSVGTVAISDSDGATTYSQWNIVNGNTDNAFSIDPITGEITINNNGGIDLEKVTTFTLTVSVTDGTHTIEQTITVTLGNTNDNAPTDIKLSETKFSEDAEMGTLIGEFTTVDLDAIGDYLYTLVSGAGDSDNANFQIKDNNLFTAATYDFDYQKTFTIRVRTTDNGGEYVEKIFILTVEAKGDMDLMIPTAFSPNGDQANDTWEVDRLISYPNCQVKIFNSDGIEVFSNHGYTKKWDGTFKGKEMDFGTYYYIIHLNDEKNGKVYKGTVMILK